MAVGKASIQRAMKAKLETIAEEKQSVQRSAAGRETGVSAMATTIKRDVSDEIQLQCPYIPVADIIAEEVRLTRTLLASIRTYGVIEPVLLYPSAEGYRILRGHRRVAAAKELGLTVVPAVVLQADAAKARLLHRELTAFERGQDHYRGGNEAVAALGENRMPEFLL